MDCAQCASRRWCSFTCPLPVGHPWLQAVRSRCWYGVDMFFILSGFLITWILAVEFENTGKVDFGLFYAPAVCACYRPISVRLCWYSRAFCLLLRQSPVGAKFFPPGKAVWPLLLTYSLNVWIAATAIWAGGFFSHFWSLCVEEHFYLSWSAGVPPMGHRDAPSSKSRWRRLWWSPSTGPDGTCS